MGSVMAFDILCSLQSDNIFQMANSFNKEKKYASDTNLAGGGTASHDSKAEDFSGKRL